jgi:hypothetical protein
LWCRRQCCVDGLRAKDWWADGLMTVKLLVRLLARTLSVPVRGVSPFASLPARTYSGQGTFFT